MKILMVCLGNICRSPIAEGILQHKIKQHGLDWQVASAGTNNYHTGEAPHRFSQKVCLQHDIDISAQRACRFTPADLQRYDIIYALATDVYEDILKIAGKHDTSRVRLFLDEMEDTTGTSVPDPWYGDESGYLPVFQLIDRACEAIIARYSTGN